MELELLARFYVFTPLSVYEYGSYQYMQEEILQISKKARENGKKLLLMLSRKHLNRAGFDELLKNLPVELQHLQCREWINEARAIVFVDEGKVQILKSDS